MSINCEYTYWASKGKHQNIADKLGEKVPLSGSVAFPKKNKKLEKFRIAVNCYHDLYNNGLGNRKAEFRKVFGVASSNYRIWNGFEQNLYDVIEVKMDGIILDAAKEQGLI